MTTLLMSTPQRSYLNARVAYDRKQNEIGPQLDTLLDSYVSLESEEEIADYVSKELAIRESVGMKEAEQELRDAENALLVWGLAQLKMHENYDPCIDSIFTSNLCRFRSKAIEYSMRIAQFIG